jgi:alpha-D-xyloside xylohydrolase
VYLPAGAGWYDFATGAFSRADRRQGRRAARAHAVVRPRRLDRADGRGDQHVGEQPDGPIVLHVFTGADGAFSLYEDDGVSPGYKQGKFARVPVKWDEGAGTLTIGARQGGYEGMPGKRAISVRFYAPGRAVGAGLRGIGAKLRL